MPSQRQSNTPQPTPGHVRDYSQVTDEELVVLTDDSTDTEREKERECEAEHKAKREEAKRWKAEEERLEAEWRKRVEEEEEARRKKAAEEEAERQRQRASEERAQARQDEATQSTVYDVNTAQRVPGTSVVVTMTRRPPCTCCVASLTAGQCEPGQGKTRACLPCHKKKKVCSWTREDVVAGPSRKRAGTGSSRGEKKKRPRGKGKERATEMEEADDEREAGGEEDKPATLLEGPSGVGVHMRWVEWERERQLQAMEKQAEAHETAVLAFERMAEAAERMVVAAEQTADEWALYRAWAEWVEMRRREDAREARMAELKRTGGGWKRPQSEVAEDKNEEVDEGAEGDNEEEEEVGGEKEGGEEQEGGGGQVMEE
ncbi:hypothetical protein M404DRAFT_26979 [Pisolithus tinctorius Marx 270]|uniref:Uncharacterized protein n=1 Tax=Pisolithus tinctorius Marx 270 TaxID=870435 RepID=A0A0C3K2C4_PISTI|nr:hypothetical protein M404DRAFT_26979 [Pisolithus tinctorius Marx 270]